MAIIIHSIIIILMISFFNRFTDFLIYLEPIITSFVVIFLYNSYILFVFINIFRLIEIIIISF